MCEILKIIARLLCGGSDCVLTEKEETLIGNNVEEVEDDVLPEEE